MKLSILLPVHNHLNFTRIAITALSSHLDSIEDNEISIIVIDDGSTDGTYEWVQQHFPEVALLQGDGNLWWSGAINMGAKYAIEVLKSHFILLWNNDISFENNYFAQLLKILKNTDNCTILGSKILIKENPSLVWSMGGHFDPVSGKNFMYGYYKQDGEEYVNIRQVDWLTGMGTIIPADIVKEIGYWNDRDFPQYLGDADFTYRAKLKGYTLKVMPELILYNQVKNSGLEHTGKISQLFRVLFDLRSKGNFARNLKFHRLYAKSIQAYFPFFWNYFKIIGGFFKWKILGIFGMQKRNRV